MKSEVSNKATMPKKVDKKVANDIQRESITDQQFFIDATTNYNDIIKADKEGKKFVFDFLDFPELPPKVYKQLSKMNKSFYVQDRRMAARAAEKVADGRDPFYNADDYIGTDPLAHVKAGSRLHVENPAENTKYLFPHYRDAEMLKRAGYDFVTVDDKEVIPNAIKTSEGRYIFKDSQGKPDIIAMKVDADKYKKHIEYYGKLSKKKIGSHKEDTKRKMRRYDSKVHLYDSKMKLTEK